jgi:hypothetical protein
MADLNKFEEMLERLVNEDKAGAEELFHEIVVEKSREIYENILESDLDDEEVDEATDEEVDESDDEEVDEATDEEVDESDDDEEVDEGFNLDEFEVEADPMADMGGDPADDMMAMVGADDEGSEEPEMDMDSEEGEGDMEDRIEDLEDAFKELQAEFDAMMDGDEAPADDEGDMDMDMDAGDEEGDEEGEEEPEEAVAFESDDEEVEEKSKEPKSAGETMREYVEKVTAKMGDTGTNGTKSAVAGKNDMGGTASNIAQSDTGDVAEAGAGSTVKGSALSDTSAKEDNAGNINVPGGKAAKAGKTEGAGHGAEKKGKPETADNKTSVVGK